MFKFWSLQTRLLCNSMQFAKLGSYQAKGRWLRLKALVTPNSWHVTHDPWRRTQGRSCKVVNFLVSWLPPTHIKRFSVPLVGFLIMTGNILKCKDVSSFLSQGRPISLKVSPNTTFASRSNLVSATMQWQRE